MDKIKILALGGLDEEGRDLYCIEINGDIIVIGGGLKTPTKTTPGIDFIISNFSYLKENKDRVIAFIVPKAKKNSFGAIPYIYQEVQAPIICTDLAKLTITKFAEKYQQVHDFKFNTIKLPATINIGGHVIDFFSTCASMPETFGFAIRTNLGNIIYSGDFIVEYANANYFKLDLNTLGKIAEQPTLLLMSESINSTKAGYCAPNHKLAPFLTKYFKEATGRIFIAVNNDNFYRINEVYQVCKDFNKKIFLYDDEMKNIYNLRSLAKDDFFNVKNIVSIDDVLRIKEQDLVILMGDEGERIYEKISILANRENEEKQIKLQPNDTFIVAAPPSDKNEVIATATVDELYKAGCNVKFIGSKNINKMHAYEEDLRMLLSLLKPKYYLPVKGYYVNLLANAKIGLDMNIGLTHFNIFLLDNGQSLYIDEKGANVDFDVNRKVDVSDVMIDGIGVGDVVNEIINERTRLSEDGVVIIGCAVSKTERTIAYGPDVQMRGFLFLKDKEADLLLKEITKIFIDDVNAWLETTKNFDNKSVENAITYKISKMIQKLNNRNPVIKPNVIVVE